MTSFRRRRIVLGLWLIGWATFGLPWGSFSSRPHWDHVRWNPTPRRTLLASLDGNRVDDLANFTFYVPLGWVGSASGWPISVVLAAAAVASFGTETAQLFSTERTPSAVDLLSNIGGAVVGIWLCLRRIRTAPG
jgi:hypothetical protein